MDSGVKPESIYDPSVKGVCMDDHSDASDLIKEQYGKYFLDAYRGIFGLLAAELSVLVFSIYLSKEGYFMISAFLTGFVGTVVAGNLFFMNRKKRLDEKFFKSSSYLRVLIYIREISEGTDIYQYSKLISPAVFETCMQRVKDKENDAKVKKIALTYFECKRLFHEIGELDTPTIMAIHKCLP
jgi:hypothetical protein